MPQSFGLTPSTGNGCWLSAGKPMRACALASELFAIQAEEYAQLAAQITPLQQNEAWRHHASRDQGLGGCGRIYGRYGQRAYQLWRRGRSSFRQTDRQTVF